MAIKRAIYAGSFDIFTTGHKNIVERALKVFDEITVLVCVSPTKKTMFTLEERLEMLKLTFANRANILVDTWDGLVVEYAKEKGIRTMVRGLRPTGDFESEFQMASINYRLHNEVDTFFLMTGGKHYFISSSMVKEIVTYGKDISKFVPPCVDEYIKDHFKKISLEVKDESK